MPERIRKFQAPDFLLGVVKQSVYERWLARKAATHVKRDRKRRNRLAMISIYKEVIHRAVYQSNGVDAYTGEKLRWDLISSYDNDAASSGGRIYRNLLALLPTIDHVGDAVGEVDFMICALRTNDAKSDLGYSDFVEFCCSVVSHFEKRER